MNKVSCMATVLGLVFGASAARAQNPPTPAPEGSSPQASPAEAYKQQRAFALKLLNTNHQLEALPIFEDLAKSNPGDAEVLLGMGACLIQHAATLANENAGKQERTRARSLLLRAKELGNNSILLNNLLDTLSGDGTRHYPGAPEVVAEIKEGEAAFAKNNYDDAIVHYSKAFELDPKNYSAVLFIGDSYFAAKSFPKAAEWYDRAIQLDPDIETAYRYEADMFTKNGDQPRARQLVIQAIVAEPYKQLSWRGLVQWANFNKLKLTPVRINTHSSISSDGGTNTNVTITPAPSISIWLAYNGVRINWHKEEFKKNFPQEVDYRHTLAEEVTALSVAASLISKEKPETIAADPDLTLLKKIADAKMLEPYVLLSAPDREIAVDYISYREKHRAQLEQYLNDFVVPPAPPKP